jgi:Na+/phosphate symporter
MLVGFVNSGIMSLAQAINVTMGANIGTTFTAWLLSLAGIESDNFFVSLLKPSTFAPIVAFVGVIILFTSKRKRDIATIMIGFSLIMMGMQLMSESVEGLTESELFHEVLLLLSNPILGVLAGAIITGIIQSSSASIGMLQALAIAGGVTYGAAIPIIMGQNIGTCVTSIISAIGTTKNAKRVAAAHLFFNIIGTVVFLGLFVIANAIFKFTFLNDSISAFGIAIVHTIFNVASTALIFPFAKQLAKLACLVVPDGKEEDKFELLDERLFSTPSIAIEQCRKLVNEMSQISLDSTLKAMETIRDYSEKEVEEVIEMEGKVDTYEDKLGAYLVQGSTYNLSNQDSLESAKLLHVIGDLERISDHAVNIVQTTQEMHDKGLQFSDSAKAEVDVITTAVTEILNNAVDCFVNNDASLARKIEPLEEVIDTLRTEIKNRHVQRLQTGECTIELGFILADLLTNLERVSDHCSNIAISVIGAKEENNIGAHEYMKNVLTSDDNDEFKELFKDYSKKYQL